MINWLHSKLYRPEKGWDPIPAQYAVRYAEDEWQKLDEGPLDVIEPWLGGFNGKEVLDLGGGPGQFTVAMARRGARVTWYDVSQNYRNFAERHNPGFQIGYAVGYLEDALRLGVNRFDLVFNRICWNYSRSDAAFAEIIWRLIRPGGIGYVDTTNSTFQYDTLPVSARLRTWLSARTRFKVGHPFPPRGRVAHLLLRLPVERALVDYSQTASDRVLFRKRS